MEKLSTKKRLAIIRDYLSGLSYGEIAVKNGISKGTVANVVTDLKSGKVPEAADVVEHIELLRELALDLRRSNLTPGQCATGLAVLKRINECGLDPADIDRWTLILKAAGSQEESQELVRTIYSIQEVRKRTGFGFDELDNKVHELEKKAADLEPVSRQCAEYEKQLAVLIKQRGNLTGAVANLGEKYKFLNPLVKDLEERNKSLSNSIKNMEMRVEKAEAILSTLNKERQGLLEIGLSIEGLAEFNQRVQFIAQSRDITPEELRNRLLQELEQLDQVVRLEALVQRLKNELEGQDQAIAQAKRERETLNTVVSGLKQEKANLEAGIKGTRDKVSREIAGIIPVTKSTINQFTEELRLGHKQALEDVRRLRDETLEVGKELGRFEGILQANQWLSDLGALVRGDESIDAKRVRVMILLVLRGAVVWLTHNKNGNLGFSTLSYHIENLVKEAEQWKV